MQNDSGSSTGEHAITTDPQDELLDTVDADNRVTGSDTRARIHSLGLRHRACHIIVFDGASRILLQQRSMTKDNSPGLWDSSSAGHVDSGESYIECAIRELKEELGLDVREDQLAPQFMLNATKMNGMEFAQVYTLVTDDPVTADAIEIAGIQWCCADELDQWLSASVTDFTPVFKEIWYRLQSNAQSSELS